jgi:hypothetical protein
MIAKNFRFSKKGTFALLPLIVGHFHFHYENVNIEQEDGNSIIVKYLKIDRENLVNLVLYYYTHCTVHTLSSCCDNIFWSHPLWPSGGHEWWLSLFKMWVIFSLQAVEVRGQNRASGSTYDRDLHKSAVLCFLAKNKTNHWKLQWQINVDVDEI